MPAWRTVAAGDAMRRAEIARCARKPHRAMNSGVVLVRQDTKRALRASSPRGAGAANLACYAPAACWYAGALSQMAGVHAGNNPWWPSVRSVRLACLDNAAGLRLPRGKLCAQACLGVTNIK